MNCNITQENIQNTLNALIGKTVSYCGSEAKSAINKLIDEYNNSQQINNWRGGFHYRQDQWTIAIYYKNYYVGSVKIKRSKGKSHYGYFSQYCDYTYKAFEVTLWKDKPEDLTLDEYIAQLDEKDAESKAKAESKKQRLDQITEEVYKFINEHYELSGSEFVELAINIRNKAYWA